MKMKKMTTFISEEAISKEIVAFIGFNMNSTKEERSKAIWKKNEN